MTYCWKTLLTAACMFIALATIAQDTYLISIEQKASRRTAPLYFYLQELPAGTSLDNPQTLTLVNAPYRLDYLRLREASPSSYFGCSKYADQAAGEELSLHDLLSDSVLYTYAQRQQAIEAQCTGLLENRGRQNSLLTVDINDQHRIKMIKVRFDLCTCKVSREKFSTVSDTLAMPRKVVDTGIFSEAEKAYWQNNLPRVWDHALVKSCLPPEDRYTQLYQVGQQ